MSAAPDKQSSTFFESISPWSTSRSTTPKPDASKQASKPPDTMQQKEIDHTVSHRHRLSLRRYPRDCPPLRTRWYYAVDIPKRKPHLDVSVQNARKLPPPKKLVPFSSNDSQSIEERFQRLADKEDALHPTKVTGSADVDITEAKSEGQQDAKGVVPVNEDFLFDVDIEKRELLPAYWLGPVYEVRRGTWFYPEGSTLRPCDENLAIQLEEGYIKVKPWRFPSAQPGRSQSKPRSRPTSLRIDGATGGTAVENDANPLRTRASTNDLKADPEKSAELSVSEVDSAGAHPPNYRLFGAYMNSTVTFQDASTAWIITDDFMSRMSSSVYQRFGAVGGTKVVRGFSEPTKPKDTKDGKVGPEQHLAYGEKPTLDKEARKDGTATPSSLKRRSAPARSSTSQSLEEDKSSSHDPDNRPESEVRRSTLERQISSLVGSGESQSAQDIEDEVRRRDERDMEDFYQDKDDEEQGRDIDHLILVTHGIGQRLGLRMESINFVHDVNVLRKTLKAVYESAPDLQALNAELDGLPKNSRVQVLPICWRHLLDFPMQSVNQNRREHDLSDADALDEEDQYPNLHDITLEGVPVVRDLLTNISMDILLYQETVYREHIATIVRNECNRVYNLFKERNPSFKGRVSLIGHSLGSAILFDVLAEQKEDSLSRSTAVQKAKRQVSDPRRKTEPDLTLDFECENFFCLGSPVAVFQMLKGKTIAARQRKTPMPNRPTQSQAEPLNDPFSERPTTASGTAGPSLLSADQATMVSSPKCDQLFNIFHPSDPIAYRLEPLISKSMASLKPQSLPYTKQGIFGASGQGLGNIGARVGQSMGSMWSNFTSGLASSFVNRSLGLTGEEQALARSTAGPSAPLSNAAGTNIGGGQLLPTPEQIAEEKKRIAAAGADSASNGDVHLPTLIDSEMETLFSGFQKSRMNAQSDESRDFGESAQWNQVDERERRLKREEAKVRALNSNGRVDYSIQE